ncbi:hypothetical protein L226DRAFT_573452 [Lentinus tigrinus ALCF2SS1-7]|uniref:Uncharacterized protein n=1 Tax=Lentinus tigrinus ALCF2SS1-6 TaxID=1328759 RepID=A0A5C2S201_9APHY|nr:hypothetical protein L227DRAFT_506883 [Lentinus tigrinus ALCF2SS1-6]RPD72093.1 hypothetical protein L226DRAFT_573452 [Lentinus tigrinus ALCF2SS1-7]
MDPPFYRADELHWTIEPARYANEYHAHTSAILPVFAQELHFIAAGTQMGGRFEVSRTGARGSDEVVVDIQADYRREQAIQEVKVHHLHSEDNKHGVKISRRTGHEHDPSGIYQTIQFHIHVRLPASAPNGVPILRMNVLKTSLPLFSHHLHRFGDSVQFDRVALRTTNCPIEAEFLVARAVSLSTSNGQVRGTFKTCELLQIDTSNAPVKVDAVLTGGDESVVPQMAIQTSNGPIQANIGLASGASPTDTDGSFDVVAHTSNSPLTVAFVEQPANSRLVASLQTANGPASVKMHPAFEGQFELRSSFFMPPTMTEGRVQDPAGAGRARTVTKHGVGSGAITGSVSWGVGAGRVQRVGRVEVQTSNAPLQFSL